MTRWVLVPLEDGRVEVRVRGKRTRTFEDEKAARSYVRENYKTRDTVHTTEEDGYRAPITRSVIRGR